MKVYNFLKTQRTPNEIQDDNQCNIIEHHSSLETIIYNFIPSEDSNHAHSDNHDYDEAQKHAS